MNKVLIISQHFPPEMGAAANRLKQLTEGLAEKGFKLYVVTSRPSYPEPAVYEQMDWQAHHDEMRSRGIQIYACPAVTRLLRGKAGRAANQLLFLFLAWWLSLYILLRHRVKLCLTTSPPFPVNLIGFTLSLLLGVRWVMEVRDLWPDSLLALTDMKESSLLFKVLKGLEHRFYHRAETVVVVTRRFKAILQSRGIGGEKIDVITNGIPGWIGEEERSRGESPLYEGERSFFKVVYIGNLGYAQGLEKILEAARLLTGEGIHFYFVGEGLAKEKLQKLAREWKLDNVTFIPGVTDKGRLLQWYLTADVGLVSLKPSPLFETVIPSKLFEYGALGVPILYIGRGEGAEIVEKYGLGFRTASDAQAIKAALEKLHQEKFRPDEKLVNQFREDYSWRRLIDQYATLLAHQFSKIDQQNR